MTTRFLPIPSPAELDAQNSIYTQIEIKQNQLALPPEWISNHKKVIIRIGNQTVIAWATIVNETENTITFKWENNSNPPVTLEKQMFNFSNRLYIRSEKGKLYHLVRRVIHNSKHDSQKNPKTSVLTEPLMARTVAGFLGGNRKKTRRNKKTGKQSKRAEKQSKRAGKR